LRLQVLEDRRQFANEKNKNEEGQGDIYNRFVLMFFRIDFPSFTPPSTNTQRSITPPDYAACVAVATEGSLREMIDPAALVIFTPLLVGFCFGKFALSGLLIGGLVSGVQMAISSSNTGGAWDNAKKCVRARARARCVCGGFVMIVLQVHRERAA